MLSLAGLPGCQNDGTEITPLETPPLAAVQETQAVEALLQLYQRAVVQEDSDQLEALVEPDTVATQGAQSAGMPRQENGVGELGSWRQRLQETFQQGTVTALTLPPAEIVLAPDRRSITFVEVESVEDPTTLSHRTRVFRTTWTLHQQEAADGTITLRIRAAQRQGPLVEITTPGQVQAGALSRVAVRGTACSLAGVEMEETGEPLQANEDGFQGVFRATNASSLASFPLRLRRSDGTTLTLTHPYRVRGSAAGVVQRLPGTEHSRLFAVIIEDDGTVWAGGDQQGSLFQVAPGSTTTTVQRIGQLLDAPDGRIEDLVIDRLGRLQAVGFAPQQSGVFVYNGSGFCQTVNALDQAYPLRTAQGQPSPATRAVAADDGAIWLLGSDGGVARVRDTLREAPCPGAGGTVTYETVLRRDTGELPANTVPALVARDDGTLWIGSALGLSRLQNGQGTRVPFNPALSFQGNPATLEAFFHEVAQAIFAARPLTTVALGDVSFLEAFGSPLLKEDLIFSLAEDARGQLWVGTLGGGLRRIDTQTLQETVHLTREDGLASNLILALASAPDGTVWAATDDGVSRIQEVNGTWQITTFGSLDGLALPARDIAVDAQGTAWVATDGGLFRLSAQSGEIRGVVQDETGVPVAGADVVIHGTPLRAVTDTQGHFTLANLPTTSQVLQVESTLATTGPLTPLFRELTVQAGSQTLAPLALASPVRLDGVPGGLVLFPTLPGASLELAPGSVQSPAGTLPTVGLTARPVTTLSRPLPSGFTAVAAADLQAPGATLTTPARLTLPNTSQLPAGQLLILLRAEPTTQSYDQLGLGRISADGQTITTLSGGVDVFTTVVLARVAANATRLFLLPVAGNIQRAQSGEALPAPLVVRLEDQFGNPVVGERLTATITRGEGTVQALTPVTTATGEARFAVQVGQEETDLVIEVATPDLPEVRPAQFFTIVGQLDTPGFAREVAVADDLAYVADGYQGMQVIDVHDPSRPALLHASVLGFPSLIPGEFFGSVALQGTRAYLASVRVYILDITDPRNPTFPADTDNDGLPDVVLGRVSTPGNDIIDLVPQGTRLYALSNTFTSAPSMLYIIDVQDPTRPRVLSATPVESPTPPGLAVVGETVYVAAESLGVVVFDVHDPTQPLRLATLGGPDPTDEVEVRVASQIAVVGDFAYVVEQHRDRVTQQSVDMFTVLDVRLPMAPRRRGTVPLRTSSEQFFLTGLAVTGPFAYVVRGSFGVEAVDIRDPDAPQPVGTVRTPGIARQLTTAGEFLYVGDLTFGLQVIRGPGMDATDTDGDGSPDFFDAFPTDPSETQDSDGDRLGDNADMDDDNDGVADVEEMRAIPPTDPTDARQFPVALPPVGVTTLMVDASTTAPPQERQGTPERPYRAVSEALRVVRSGLRPEIRAIEVQPGLYAALTTRESFPLDLGRLEGFTLRAVERGTAVLDAGFQSNVINAEFSRDLVVEGFVVTHGVRGISVRESSGVLIQGNQARANSEHGIVIGRNANQDNAVIGNVAEGSGRHGIFVAANAAAEVAQNVVRDNAEHGIDISLGAHAEVHDNVVTHTVFDGIAVASGSTAEVRNNIAEGSQMLSGIAVVVDATATVTQNIIRGNKAPGLRVVTSTITADENVIVDNGGCGILVNNSMATIRGNTVSQNRAGGSFNIFSGHGICVVDPFNFRIRPSHVTIGLDTSLITEITNNEGAGISLDEEGSTVEIDSRNIVCDGNAQGCLVGNVTDIAP